MVADFWDTSSIAKLYLNETGSEWAAARLTANTLALSALTSAELAALLARRNAEGKIDQAMRDDLYARFLADSARYQVLAVSSHLIERASSIALSGMFSTRVRASDMIQLATARRWFERASERNLEPGAFVVADRPLRDAAIVLGLAVENPEDYE